MGLNKIFTIQKHDKKRRLQFQFSPNNQFLLLSNDKKFPWHRPFFGSIIQYKGGVMGEVIDLSEIKTNTALVMSLKLLDLAKEGHPKSPQEIEEFLRSRGYPKALTRIGILQARAILLPSGEPLLQPLSSKGPDKNTGRTS